MTTKSASTDLASDAATAVIRSALAYFVQDNAARLGQADRVDLAHKLDQSGRGWTNLSADERSVLRSALSAFAAEMAEDADRADRLGYSSEGFRADAATASSLYGRFR